MQTPHHKQLFTFLAIFIVGMCVSFVLGRASQTNKHATVQKSNSEVVFISSQDLMQDAENNGSQDVEIRASSRGKKYYFPWCTSTFSEANTIYFSSVQEAEEKGYTLATNCIPQKN